MIDHEPGQACILCVEIVQGGPGVELVVATEASAPSSSPKGSTPPPPSSSPSRRHAGQVGTLGSDLSTGNVSKLR